MRLIDADEAIGGLISKQVVLDEINKMPTVTDTNGAKYIEKTCLGIRINMLLPVDAVPVVRCKDCYHGSLQSNETKTYHCLEHNAMMEGHYFCNLGEREPPRQKYLICRKCGHGWFGKYNFCPHCGADMRKDGDDNA